MEKSASLVFNSLQESFSSNRWLGAGVTATPSILAGTWWSMLLHSHAWICSLFLCLEVQFHTKRSISWVIHQNLHLEFSWCCSPQDWYLQYTNKISNQGYCHHHHQHGKCCWEYLRMRCANHKKGVLTSQRRQVLVENKNEGRGILGTGSGWQGSCYTNYSYWRSSFFISMWQREN